MKNENLTPGMEKEISDYKKSKFENMIHNFASNPTMPEIKKATADVDKELLNTEASAMASRWEAQRILDQDPSQYDFGEDQNKLNAAEAGYRGRIPQSAQEDYVTKRDNSGLVDLNKIFEMPELEKTTKQKAESFIGGKEGFRSVPYYDRSTKGNTGEGNLTVGYGQNIEGWTPEQVQELYKTGLSKNLENRASENVDFVRSYSKVPLTENQEIAYASLADNAGPAVAKNALDILARDGVAASQDYVRQIVTSGGVKLQGLVNRRNEEAAMLSQDYGQPREMVGNYPRTSARNMTTEQIKATNEKIGQGQGQFFTGYTEATKPSSEESVRSAMETSGSTPSFAKSAYENVATKRTPSPEAQKPAFNVEDVAKNNVAKIQEKVAASPVLKDDPVFQVDMSKYENLMNEISSDLSKGMMEAAKQKAAAAQSLQDGIMSSLRAEETAKVKYENDLRNLDDEVKRNRLWEDMPLTNKLMAAVSLFAGSLTLGPQNQAMDILRSEIAKDVQNQELEYKRKGDKAFNMYKVAMKYANDEQDARKITYAATMSAIANKLEEIDASVLPKQTAAGLEKFKLEYANELRKAVLDNLKARVQIGKDIAASEYDKLRGINESLDISRKQAERTPYEEGTIANPDSARDWYNKKSNTIAATNLLRKLSDVTRSISRFGGVTKLPSEERMKFDFLMSLAPEAFSSITTASGVSREFVGSQLIGGLADVTARRNFLVNGSDKVADQLYNISMIPEEYAISQIQQSFINPATGRRYGRQEASDLYKAMAREAYNVSEKSELKPRR